MGLCQKPLLPPTKTHLRYNNEKAGEWIKTKPRYFGLTLSSKVSLSDSPQNNSQTQIPIFFWDFSPFLSLTLTSLSLTNPWEMLLGGAVGKKPFPAGEAALLPRCTRFPSGCQHHLCNPSPSPAVFSNPGKFQETSAKPSLQPLPSSGHQVVHLYLHSMTRFGRQMSPNGLGK